MWAGVGGWWRLKSLRCSHRASECGLGIGRARRAWLLPRTSPPPQADPLSSLAFPGSARTPGPHGQAAEQFQEEVMAIWHLERGGTGSQGLLPFPGRRSWGPGVLDSLLSYSHPAFSRRKGPGEIRAGPGRPQGCGVDSIPPGIGSRDGRCQGSPPTQAGGPECDRQHDDDRVQGGPRRQNLKSRDPRVTQEPRGQGAASSW